VRIETPNEGSVRINLQGDRYNYVGPIQGRIGRTAVLCVGSHDRTITWRTSITPSAIIAEARATGIPVLGLTNALRSPVGPWPTRHSRA
jgi:hypothetical protein